MNTTWIRDRAEEFLTGVRERYGADLADTADVLPVEPIYVENPYAPSALEVRAIVDAYRAAAGVAYIVSDHQGRENEHPALPLVRALLSEISSLAFPISHPLDERDGPTRGLVTVMDRAGVGVRGSDALKAHQAGFGRCGTVETVLLGVQSPPLACGFTYFQNVAVAAARLAETDAPAFESLFRPDAIRVRRTSHNPLELVMPHLYVGESGEPRCFIQSDNIGYQVTHPSNDALHRGVNHLKRCLQPLSPGMRFVHLSRPGQLLVIRNSDVAHGRTPFLDGGTTRRRLVRKWFASGPEYTGELHAPGLCLRDPPRDHVRLGYTQGAWRYDPDRGENIREA